MEPLERLLDRDQERIVAAPLTVDQDSSPPAGAS
jgi:hypothetical protein